MTGKREKQMEYQHGCPKKRIDEFVAGHEDWLKNQITRR